MEQHLLLSGRDTFLIAIPFVFILTVTIFRLDQIIAAPKEAVTGRRLACGVDEHGGPVLRDPDGRLSGPARRKKDSRARGAGSAPPAHPAISTRKKRLPDRKFDR